MISLAGLPVYTNPRMTVRRFVTPPDPFVSYDESDYGWLAYFGFGRWVEEPDPTIYSVDSFGTRYLVAHPDTLARAVEMFNARLPSQQPNQGGQ